MIDTNGASRRSGRRSGRHLSLVAAAALAILATTVATTGQAQGLKRSGSPKNAASAADPSTRLVVPGFGSEVSGMSRTIDTPVSDVRTADYIVAVVNQEPITNSDVTLRMLRVLQETPADKQPPREELRGQVLDTLIEERSQLARASEMGMRVDEVDLDRAVESIAAQNELSVPQLKQRLAQDGQDYERFRRMLRERIMLDRLREREVPPRIKITESDIDGYISEQLGQAATERELSVAQILVSVKDGASEAEVAQRKARAEEVLAKARSGGDFIKLAHDYSDDATTREAGGELGWKATSQLPDLFVGAATTLKPGDIGPVVLRSGAGFHVIKLIDRRDAIKGYAVVQHHARHILIRPTPQLPQRVIVDKLSELRQLILGGQASFAQLARQYSQDGSATKGGDLGWSQPGQFVPEFQQVLDRMQPGQISQPVTTRFGVHLIQLLERRDVPVDPKQLRDNARNALREQRFEAAYQEWARDIRAQAYVEIREAQPGR
ncbi:MAG: molecular chaperone SurA [Aquabacterium sp.]|nr:MAG: molecular chaperone SurA [Aquabacterium sp.]